MSQGITADDNRWVSLSRRPQGPIYARLETSLTQENNQPTAGEAESKAGYKRVETETQHPLPPSPPRLEHIFLKTLKHSEG